MHSNGQLRTERYGDTEKGCQKPAVQHKTTDDDDDGTKPFYQQHRQLACAINRLICCRAIHQKRSVISRSCRSVICAQIWPPRMQSTVALKADRSLIFYHTLILPLIYLTNSWNISAFLHAHTWHTLVPDCLPCRRLLWGPCGQPIRRVICEMQGE